MNKLDELTALVLTLNDTVKLETKFFSPIFGVCKQFAELLGKRNSKSISKKSIEFFSNQIYEFFVKMTDTGSNDDVLIYVSPHASNNLGTATKIHKLASELSKLNDEEFLNLFSEELEKPNNDCHSVLKNIFNKFNLVFRSLSERYNNRSTITMDDEYDAQDLLRALLKLHFDDVRDEEYTPSYGGNSSRIDFLLNKEQIAIEVKFPRKNLLNKEISTELNDDVARYQKHPQIKYLYCFVFDKKNLLSNPAAIENDISGKNGEIFVSVVVRPKL